MMFAEDDSGNFEESIMKLSMVHLQFFELDRSTSLFSWNTSQPRIVYPDARATSIECAELLKTPILLKCTHLFVHTCVYNPTFVPRTQWCIPS